jgi:hypothetical protein
MEARATINTASVSRTFLAAVLVLVAMGLAAMAGYAAKGVFGANGAGAVTSIGVGHPAPGTVLRQDNPPQAPAELPGWMQQELSAKPAAAPIIVDDPNYYGQYLASPEPEPRSKGHGNLP